MAEKLIKKPKNYAEQLQYVFYVENDDLPQFLDDFIRNHKINKYLLKRWKNTLSWLSGRRLGSQSEFLVGILSSITKDPNRNKIFINKLLPILKAYLAKLFKIDPIISVLPKEGEIGDVMKAEYSENIIAYVLEKNNYRIARMKVAANIFIFNRGIWKVFWDESMKGEGKGGRELKGDIRVIAVDPWEVYDDPHGRFIVHKYYLPADLVIERFAEAYNSLYKKEFPELRPINYESVDGKALYGIPVYEYYERPSSVHPNGRTVIIADKEIVWEGDLPPGGIPFVISSEVINYGEDVDLSTMRQLIPPTQYYNKLVNFILDNIEVMGSIMWAFPAGEFQVTAVENTPGKAILYTPGSPPYQIQPKPLPNHVLLMLRTMLTELEEISGQHEVSHGKAPFSNMPASALSLLLEQDDTKMAMTRELFYSGLREVAIKILSIAQAKYTSERIIRVLGDNKTYIAKTVKGKDITFSDVKIQVVSNMPLTKQGQINFVFQLWQNQLIRDPKRALQLLGLDSLKIFQEQIMADTNKARRENERMKGLVLGVVQGSMDINMAMQVAASYVMPDEDHGIHLQEHLNFLKQENWEELDERTKAIFMAHINEHKKQQSQMLANIQPPKQGGTFSEFPQGQGEAPQGAGPTAGGQPSLPPEILLQLMGGGEEQ